MRIAYYPGCSLEGTAKEYNDSIKAVMKYLEVELVEIPDWNCCGASSTHMLDPEITVKLPWRNLKQAELTGEVEILAPCAACFARLKYAQKEGTKELTKYGLVPLKKELKIVHIHEFLSRKELIRKIKASKKCDISSLSVVTYYGCLSLRHPKVLDVDVRECENPTFMESILEACGAKVLEWSYKSDCCGGNLAIPKTNIQKKLSQKIFEAASYVGANAIVTDCPMCQINLDMRAEEIGIAEGKRYNIPILYLTEVMALAFGIANKIWWNKHFVDPRPVIENLASS